MPTYKLTYFNGRGRGELTRMAFAVGGIKFEDNRIKVKDWPSTKPKMPQGTMPVLETDGKILVQSLAIATFVGRQCGLMGKTSWDHAQINCVLDTLEDIWRSNGGVIAEPDVVKRKENIKKFTEETIPKTMDFCEKMIIANTDGKGFLVGHNLTLADLALFTTMEYSIEMLSFELDKFPKVSAHRKKVSQVPRIADYLKKRQKEDELITFLWEPALKQWYKYTH